MAFQQNVHNFRAFAILGVVAAHSLHNFAWPEQSLAFRILDTAFNQSTIWFAFIAGYLFQHLSKRYNTRSYYEKKLRNVIVPYLICSIPALVASMTFVEQEVPPGFYQKPMWEQVFLFLVTGKHLAPYWYIPMITVIFIAAPALIALDRSRHGYWLLVPLIPLSAVLGRDGLLPLLGSPYLGAISKAVYLLSPYMLGMFVSRYQDEVGAFVRRHYLLLSLVAGIFFVLEVSFYHRLPALIFLFKMVSAPVILTALNVSMGRAQSTVDLIATLSFGIFFLHGYFLALAKIVLSATLGEAVIAHSYALLYPLFVALIVALSLASIQLVKRLTGKRSSYLIGC